MVADFLDGAGDDGGGIFGVVKFEVHAASDVLQFEHGASPGGTGDADQNGLGAKLGMAGKQGQIFIQHDGGVAMILGLNFEHGRGGKIFQENAAFHFRLNDVAIYFVAEIGVGREQ